VPRDDSRPTSRTRAMLRRLRALPLGPLAVVALLLLSALVPLSPIRDAATFGAVPAASLHRPAGYLLLAPVSNVLDTLTLLSVRQHIALLVTLILGYALWWATLGRVFSTPVAPRRRAMRIAARVGTFVVLVVALYAAAAVLPRPMAALEVGPDILTVDFHSHTRYSHDGRPDWSAEDNRSWHRNAGFAAAYVTDHRTFEGARDAWANNPASAGEGVSLLPAIEVVWRGEHVNVLDADRMYRGMLTPTLRDVDEDALRMASGIPGNEPVLIETIPGDPYKTIAAGAPGTAGVRALEVVDGAPRGLGQSRRERTRLVHLADSADIAIVAGSDHHGWGRTAAAWTMLYLPDWRAIPPERLSTSISTILRRGRRASTIVAERYVADTDEGVKLPLTVPLVAWGMFRTLSGDERVVWLAWLAALYLLDWLRRARLRATTDRAVRTTA
jgi:predicted metal-dependent phosphoesterase TrpH